MGGGTKKLGSHLVMLPLLVLGIGVGAIAPKMLLAKPTTPAAHVAKKSPVKKAKLTAKKVERMKPAKPKHVTIPASTPVTGATAGSGDYYKAAASEASKRYGAENSEKAL